MGNIPKLRATHPVVTECHHPPVNNPHLPESRPYFLDIFDILPRCSSNINRSPRLLWMHPHYEKGLVWDAPRIELLWDSILRGLPIGSFTTCGGSEPSSHGRLYDDLLLDGEQRCLAIALGMHGPEMENPAHDPDLILWIDLDPRIPPHSEREFLLRLTTAEQPWGYGKSDDCPPLPSGLIKDTLSGVRQDPGHMRQHPRPRDLFPFDANVPVPLGWLIREIGKAPAAFWEAIENRAVFSRIIPADRVSAFFNSHSSAARKSREKIHAAITSLARYRIISHFMLTAISSNVKVLDAHLRRLHPPDPVPDFFLKSTAAFPRLRAEIRRISKRRMPPEHLFAIALSAFAEIQDPDQILDPACLTSLSGFLGGNPDPLPELESFVTGELETRLATMERLLLYDPLTSPQGIVPAHLALIARDKPEIHAFLLATDWPPEDLADMFVPANPERDELIKAVTMIACFAHDVTAAVHVCRDFAEKSKLWIILGQCAEEGIMPELPEPQSTLESTEIDPAAHKLTLLYAKRDHISRHSHSFDPSRRDHWQGLKWPWEQDPHTVRTYANDGSLESAYGISDETAVEGDL